MCGRGKEDGMRDREDSLKRWKVEGVEGEGDKIEGDDDRSGLWMVDRIMLNIKELGPE